jgi:hypothetical protein
MSIQFKKNLIKFCDLVSVEDAENLLGWLNKNPSSKLDFSACVHLHSANLQVLMASKAPVYKWPEDIELSSWLHQALGSR